MTIATDLFADDDAVSSGALILRELEIYNWGPFEGLHLAAFDEKGTAIIGPTGSGKTTLVDALMTLITEQPKYNLASTGGHESDRDIVSYIRGVSGTGNNSGDNSHVSRPDKTVTGLRARFANESESVTIGAVLWMDGTNSSASDMKRIWLFSKRDDQSLENWLEVHHEGGARALNQLARDTEKLQTFPSKRAYLAELRRFFEVGDNAFTLLNRAAGLKQLNSIDEIFRELVLDDNSAIERAAEVASEFDDLTAIHEELETARRQFESLLPIERSNHNYTTLKDKLSKQQQLLHVMPIYFADIGYKLWGERLKGIDAEVEGLSQEITEITGAEKEQEKFVDSLKAIYLEAGGASIEQLEEQIETQIGIVEERSRNADDYQRLVRSFELDDALTPEAFHANKKLVGVIRAELEQKEKELEGISLGLGAGLVAAENTKQELQEELGKVEARPSSNIPGKFQDFRSDLAIELGISEEQLPFVAELIEVKADESLWRGAIERAIGTHRLRILVPEKVMQDALNWVNSRDNNLHVRLLEAREKVESARFFDDGFTRKLNFKLHQHRETLKFFLAGIDRHCVDSPEQLHKTPNGMTAQGLMSGSRGQFEKKDDVPLRQGWITGFDNRHRLAELRQKHSQAKEEVEKCRAAYNAANTREQDARDRAKLIGTLSELEFSTIDLPGSKKTLENQRNRLEAIIDPNSSTAKAKVKYEEADKRLKEIREELKKLEGKRGGLEERRKVAFTYQQSAFNRIGDGLTDEGRQLANDRLPGINADDLENLSDIERAERVRIEEITKDMEGTSQKLQRQLVGQMAAARNLDTGAFSEVGTDLQDIPHYLERLRVLNEEALPEKLQRFLNYLNESSDQGVTQLLVGIDNEVARIEERIADLNNTLLRVDFQPGRYLRLEPQKVVHERLRALQNAQKHLRSAALKGDEGESHYIALSNLVQILREAADNKRTVGSRALLDPRYRLQFSVAVVDRESKETIEVRTGSQGGSGGEKEIIASYILTASLSYALCPEGRTKPLFGTIVLDEAFSKSSQAVAGRIVSALREFGLHPLFVTPNKEMQLLRSHTRSAILVHRKASRATLTSLSWEELQAHALSKLRA